MKKEKREKVRSQPVQEPSNNLESETLSTAANILTSRRMEKSDATQLTPGTAGEVVKKKKAKKKPE